MLFERSLSHFKSVEGELKAEEEGREGVRNGWRLMGGREAEGREGGSWEGVREGFRLVLGLV